MSAGTRERTALSIVQFEKGLVALLHDFTRDVALNPTSPGRNRRHRITLKVQTDIRVGGLAQAVDLLLADTERDLVGQSHFQPYNYARLVLFIDQ